MVYKTETKKFMNETGRFINVDGEEWLVVKDMFNWLGRLRADGQVETTDRNKLIKFLKNIRQETAGETFTITSKGRKQSRETQEAWCIKIDVVPMVLTQFEPTARAGKERHDQWCELMQFINNILMELEVHKFITVDKDYQKDCMERLRAIVPDSCPDNVYKTVNNHIAMIMGQLMSMNSPIYKKDITQFNNQTTVDLLVVREEALDLYLTMYELTNSFEQSYNNTLNVMKKRHNIA